MPGLSLICRGPIQAHFDGAQMASGDGLLVLREVKRRLGIARRLAACIGDPCALERIVHGLDCRVQRKAARYSNLIAATLLI